MVEWSYDIDEMRDRLRKNRHDRGAGGAKLNEPGQEVVRGPDEC